MKTERKTPIKTLLKTTGISFFLFGFIFSPELRAKTTSNDPSSAAFEFKSIVKAVLEQASSIESQKAILAAAQEMKTSKSLYWTPIASVTITNQNMALLSGSGNVGNTTTATANLNVFKFGSSELSRRAANSKVTAEEARLSQTKEDVETSVANLLFQLIQQRQIIEIRKGHVSVQQQSVDVAKERYRQGQLAEQEYEKAKVDYEASQIFLAEAQLGEVQIVNSIKTLAEVNPKVTDWPLTLNRYDNKNTKVRKNPQDFFAVRAFTADTDYFHKNAQQLWRSSYLPSLDATGGWTDLGNGSSQQGQWYAGLTLTIPLWDQWAGVAQAQESEASARAAMANLNQSLRQSQANLETLDLRVQLARKNLESSKQSVTKLQELRNDSLRRFRLGRLSVNDLLIDETRFLDAENSLLNSMSAYHQLIVEQCHIQNESILNCF